jgi:hypothetical protein
VVRRHDSHASRFDDDAARQFESSLMWMILDSSSAARPNTRRRIDQPTTLLIVRIPPDASDQAN